MEGMAGRVDAIAATAVTHPEVTEAVDAAERAGAFPALRC